MKNSANQRTGVYINGIAWLLLFIFSGLFSAEVLHSHKSLQGSEVSVSHSPDEASIASQQLFCKLCDYILHQSNHLLPVACHFILAPAKVIPVVEFVQTESVYTFDDRLLFSGNSPPQA